MAAPEKANREVGEIELVGCAAMSEGVGRPEKSGCLRVSLLKEKLLNLGGL